MFNNEYDLRADQFTVTSSPKLRPPDFWACGRNLGEKETVFTQLKYELYAARVRHVTHIMAFCKQSAP